MGPRGESAQAAGLLRETLREGGRAAVVTVASRSMEPTLREGDRIKIEGTEPSRLRRGDIVVYESPLAGLVVHRVMWKVPPLGEPRALYTKGDALAYLDRPVAVRDVLGRVVEIERGDRRRGVRGASRWARWLMAAAAWSWRKWLSGIGRTALIAGERRW